MTSPTKPLPIGDIDSKPYWEAAKAHELRAQQCSDCGRFRWPPGGVCPNCHSWNSQWTKLPGTGIIVSYIVVHQPIGAFASDVPYVMAKIAVDGTDDHAIIISNVTGCPWEQVRVGMRVTAFFDDVTDEVTLPKFKPLD